MAALASLVLLAHLAWIVLRDLRRSLVARPARLERPAHRCANVGHRGRGRSVALPAQDRSPPAGYLLRTSSMSGRALNSSIFINRHQLEQAFLALQVHVDVAEESGKRQRG
jgi:hypothetical protein